MNTAQNPSAGPHGGTMTNTWDEEDAGALRPLAICDEVDLITSVRTNDLLLILDLASYKLDQMEAGDPDLEDLGLTEETAVQLHALIATISTDLRS